jgi:hypothetical protein
MSDRRNAAKVVIQKVPKKPKAQPIGCAFGLALEEG